MKYDKEFKKFFKINNINCVHDYPVIGVFIIFKTIQDKIKFFNKFRAEGFLLEGNRLRICNADEPGNIKWENYDATKL